MSGATEATLAELLNTAEAMNINLQRLLSAGGAGGGGGGDSGGVPQLSKAAKVAAVGVVALGAAAKAASAIFDTLTGIVGKIWTGLTATIGSLYEFSKSAAMGSVKLSEFYDSLKQLPFFIGTVAGFLADITRYNEKLLEVYQTLTQAGASFGGSLDQVSRLAAKSFLSLDEFQKVVSANSEIFATMGGNVQSGINKFVDVQNRLMGPNSQYALQLLGLGYTYEEAANLVASYMKSQGTLTKDGLKNNSVITASVMDLAIEIDNLSKITGKRKEQVEQEIKELQEEQEWQSYVATLSEQGAKNANAVLMNVTQAFGKEFGPSVRLALQTGIVTPLNDLEGQRSVFMRGGRESFLKLSKELAESNLPVAEIGKRLRIEAGEQAKSYGALRQSLGPLPYVFSATNNNMLQSMHRLQAFGRTVGDVNKAQSEAEAERKKQAEGQAARFAQAQNDIQQFGRSLFMLVHDVLSPFTGTLKEMITNGVKFVKEVLANPEFKAAIERVTKWFSDTFKYLSSSGNMSTFFERLFNVMVTVFEAIKPRFLFFAKHAFIEIGTVIKEFFLGGPTKDIANANEELSEAIEKQQKIIAKQQELKDKQTIDGKPVPSYMLHQESELLKGQLRRAKKDELEAREDLAKAEKAAQEKYRNRELTRQREWQQVLEEERLPMIYLNQTIYDPNVKKPDSKRHSGTFGMTSSWYEKSDATLNVAKGESVVTSEQLSQIVAGSAMAGQNSLVSAIETLNNNMSLMAKYAKDTAEYARRTELAIKSLDGNLFTA